MEDDVENEVGNLDVRLVHQNQPILMAVYKDGKTLAERVCVCVSLTSGARDVRFALLGTGPATTTASITYKWPKVMYHVESLFESAIRDKTLSPTDAKIVALKLELENNRDHIETAPQGYMELSLPIPVQTAGEAVNYRCAKNNEGDIVLIADLCAFHTSYTVKKKESACKFQPF